MTDDHLAIEAQAAADETKLAVAMRGLVQVHEIHVNGRPGDLTVVLRVQMQERFLQEAQTRDPHLGGREGVHPGDQDQYRSSWSSLPDTTHGSTSGVVNTGLNTTFTGHGADAPKRRRDLARMFGDCFQRFRSIQMLTPRHKPDFILLQINHDCISFNFIVDQAGFETRLVC